MLNKVSGDGSGVCRCIVILLGITEGYVAALSCLYRDGQKSEYALKLGKYL
jgi:hypothetical protein